VKPPAAPTLRVLTGCTAVGKTEWALRWAEAHGAEIISCDSLLFYRGLDIGTAKPSPADRARVPHHLIDLLDLTESMNAARYAEEARRTAQAIAARGRPVLVVGGSGFYLRTFFGAVADGRAVPPDLRLGIEARLASAGLPALVAELRRLNPAGLGDLDVDNPRRVARALERCLASGRTLAELAAEFALQPFPFAGWNVRLVRLDRPPAELATRIAARVDAMLRAGLVEEVTRMLAAGLRDHASASRAIGYREVIAWLDGGRALPEAALAALIAQDTRALVKKQRTWFRTQLPPHGVVHPSQLGSPTDLFAEGPDSADFARPTAAD
jgi:tRNA dimethylallyltransferase